MNKVIISSIVGVSLLAGGCASYLAPKDLDGLQINQSKESVIANLKADGILRGSIKNKDGQIIEVREYRLERGKTNAQTTRDVVAAIFSLGITIPITMNQEGQIETYWLYFADGKLVKWGKAGDWEVEKSNMFDFRFGGTKNPELSAQG